MRNIPFHKDMPYRTQNSSRFIDQVSLYSHTPHRIEQAVHESIKMRFIQSSFKETFVLVSKDRHVIKIIWTIGKEDPSIYITIIHNSKMLACNVHASNIDWRWKKRVRELTVQTSNALGTHGMYQYRPEKPFQYKTCSIVHNMQCMHCCYIKYSTVQDYSIDR